MKYRITEVYNKENGHLCGYTIAYKPFPLIPYWVDCNKGNKIYKNIEQAEHDIIWLQTLDGTVKRNERYV